MSWVVVVSAKLTEYLPLLMLSGVNYSPLIPSRLSCNIFSNEMRHLWIIRSFSCCKEGRATPEATYFASFHLSDLSSRTSVSRERTSALKWSQSGTYDSSELQRESGLRKQISNTWTRTLNGRHQGYIRIWRDRRLFTRLGHASEANASCPSDL